MGLDVVELVLEVEDEFGVSFPDDRYSHLATVGEMCLAVVDEVRVQKGEILDVNETFERLRVVICEVLHVSPQKVAWDSDFIRDLRAG